MQVDDLILWGFAGTIILTTMMAGSKHLGLTRMDIPFILGTMLTSNRDKAHWFGFIVHLIVGWIFAFIYGASFESADLNTWWFGLLIGLVHGAFVLSVGMQIIGAFHPRMARPYQGPTPTRQLEPPGFFAKNYGKGTSVVTLIAHAVYGGVIGFFYG